MPNVVELNIPANIPTRGSMGIADQDNNPLSERYGHHQGEFAKGAIGKQTQQSIASNTSQLRHDKDSIHVMDNTKLNRRLRV
jgi:hypothetical protein